jgi:cell wall-associated NlpC family hydrolase
LLASAAPAAAAGPVFAILPSGPAAAPAPTPESSTDLQARLDADRAALDQAVRDERRASAVSDRATSAVAAAGLFSDQLEADKAAFQSQWAADDASAEIERLRQEISTLESELQPVVAPPPLTNTAASSLGTQAVAIAEQYLGIPYVWGKADPASGFDCSGLTMYVYAQLGIQLTHFAAAQFGQGMPVDPAQLQPGDLVFFEPRSSGPGHVGIYIGGDSFIAAPHSGDVVKISSLTDAASGLGFVGAVRPYLAPAFAGQLVY